MKPWIKYVLLTITVLTLIGVVVAVQGCSNGGTPATSSAFETTALAVNPSEVYPGVEVVVTAQVTNTSDAESTYTAGLSLGDETVGTTEITLAAGESKPVSFTKSMANPGTYRVTWTELVGEFLVPRLTGKLVVVGDGETGSTALGTAPDFTSEDVLTGETISLSQYSGSVILLNFVNYGCSQPTNEKVSAQLLTIKALKAQRDDFIPVSVFCGCCPKDVLRQFATDNQLTWPWILDTDYSVVPKYTSYISKYGYPTLILIDKDQKIIEVSGSLDASELAAIIDQLTQGGNV